MDNAQGEEEVAVSLSVVAASSPTQVLLMSMAEPEELVQGLAAQEATVAQGSLVSLQGASRWLLLHFFLLAPTKNPRSFALT